MDDRQAEDVLRRLGQRDPAEGWSAFLDLYSPLLFDVVRRFERDAESIADCYVFVCQQLSEHGFRRLLRFRPDGPARFSTWLRAVARNLCLDWHRLEFGRQRVFASIARLTVLDQEIFRALFLERVPIEDVWLKLEPHHPGLTIQRVAERADAVGRALTSRQRWLLAVRAARGAPRTAAQTEEDEQTLLRIPGEMPNPESWAGLQEERAALHRAMARLPASDRLLIKLRFSRELTLAAIASVMGLENPQAADRRIRYVVDTLRREMTENGQTNRRGGNPGDASV